MKALTVTQPWATLIASGAKHVETRSWATSHRGPLLPALGLEEPADDPSPSEVAG